MPLSLVSLLLMLLLLICLHLVPAARASQPRVLATRWPSTLSAFAPHQLTIVLTKPLFRPRLQLLSDPPRTLFPASTTPLSPNSVALVFRVPPLPPSQPRWQLLVVHANANLILTHPVNDRIVIVPPPLIRSVHPRILHPFKTSLVLLTGNFPPNPRIFINNRRVPPRRIPLLSRTEIIVRVRPSLAQSPLSFFVLASDGTSSPVFNVSVRKHLIPISATPLHASYHYSAAHYVLSSLCTDSTPVVYFQAHALRNSQLPVFNVSYRTSLMPPASFRPLQTFSSSTVLSLPDQLFSEEHQSQHVVTVVITCAHSGRVGQTLLFISQQTSVQVFGISVFPHVHQMAPLHRTAVLRASLSSTYCSRTAETSVQLIWRVNNTIVQPLQNMSTSLPAITRPSTTGLGNTLVVPVEGRFVYVVQAVLQHAITRKVIARAAATGVAVVRKGAPYFKAVLNGAATALTLPPGITDYPIRVDVYEQSQYGVLFSSKSRFLFQWSCSMILDDIPSACTSQLFSPWLATENSLTSSFQISTVGVEAGTRVEYSVLVMKEASAGQRLNLTLNIAAQESELVFPSDAMLRAALKSAQNPIGNEEPSFKCHESIVLSWNQAVSQEFDFKLFREGQAKEILSSATDELVISYDGYWTKERPFGRFFGVSASLLTAGRYTLHGAVNRTAGPGNGASWRFSVQPCPTLVVGDLAITDGTTNETVFHAAAYSLPSSENLYAFMLRREESVRTGNVSVSAEDRQNVSDFSTCLNGCTGKPVVSFTVSHAGQYRIVVEMYDPSGSYLLGSEMSNSTLTVRDSGEEEMQAPNKSVVEVLNSTLLHRDEARFVDSLLSVQSNNVSLDTPVIDLLTVALRRIVSGPTVNALQCTQYVKACASLLSLEALNSTSLENTLSIIDMAVEQSISYGSPGFHLRQALRDFYGRATRTVYEISQRRASAGEADEEVSEIADRTRQSAAQAIPLVLSAGRACGVVDSERVDVSGMVGVSQNDERNGVKAFDDYRIGVSCFPGQIKRLTPEPATVQACAQKAESKRDDDGSIYVLTSVEQHNVLGKALPSGSLDGPQIDVKVFQQVEQRGRINLMRISERSAGCYGTRVSVYASRNVSETFSLLESQRVTCADAGTVTEAWRGGSRAALRQEDAVTMASEFEFDAERNRVSAVVEGELPVKLRLQVNGTRLSECIRLSGGSINGRSRAASVAIWLPLVCIAVCAAVVTALVLWRFGALRKLGRLTRRGGAEWHVGGVDADGGTRDDGLMSSSSDETVDVTTSVPIRFAARGETGSIGTLEDERGSAGSSLLTATVSHMTSSSGER